MELILPSGDVALFDKEDARLISQYRWRIRRDGPIFYAFTTHRANGEPLGRKISMHRLVMGMPPAEYLVDHRNLNGLDNRRENLRLVNHSQNAQNCHGRGKCKYKGVYPKGSRWRATITHNHTKYHLGYFDTPEKAAEAYDEQARKFFGACARTNF